MEELLNLTGFEIARRIKLKKIAGKEVYDFFQERIKMVNPALNSFITKYTNVDKIEGNSSLSGVPIALKDNICIKGKRITCASRILSKHKAAYDATVVEKIKKAGLSISGITNMDEFAFGSSTENSCYGVTKNPWDLSRVSGGSSGGSAAAVAARLVPFALGSDTGGSIRQPSSLCGVVGFKPTYGRVSRYGLIAFGSSLDQIGPVTTNFIDSAHLLNIICGCDSKDSTSSDKQLPDFTQALRNVDGVIKIGLPKEYFGTGLDSEVREIINNVVKIFKEKKVQFKEISLPHTEYAVATYYIIASSEASSNLQRFDGVKYGTRAECSSLKELYSKTRGHGFGEEAKRRILLGTHSLSSGYYEAYYLKALKVRRLIRNDFDNAFKDVDAILTPTAPTTAFKIGEKADDPLSMYLSDIYTISANLAGIPAVSFPGGFTKSNLPVGVQLIGRHFDESTLIQLGFLFQEVTDFHKAIPKISNE